MFLSALPLIALPVIAYNLYAALLPGGFDSILAAQSLARPLFSMHTRAGGVWPVSAADLMVAVSLLVFFVELIRTSPGGRLAMINHAASLLLFAACLVEMLLAPAFANSTFFLLTLMTLLDVVAGLILTMTGRAGETDGL